MNKPLTQIDQVRSQLVALTPELRNALPSHIKPEKFQRVVMTAIQLNPDLLQETLRRSLWGACIKCATDGLLPDGREAALVIFKGKQGPQVSYIPMFAGIQKRVRNSGEVSSIGARVIRENDHFVWREGTEGSLEHVPLFPGDRGKIVGAYAFAKFKDGSPTAFEVMSIQEIERIRQFSRNKDGLFWTNHYEEMAKKTVFKRLAKWLPMDADLDELLAHDESAAVAEPTGTVQIEGTAERDPFEDASAGNHQAIPHEMPNPIDDVRA